jgi:protein-tyrosine-phosphatase
MESSSLPAAACASMRAVGGCMAMTSRAGLLVLIIPLLFAGGAAAQKEQRQTLTETQVEKIREAGIDPDQRIKLYTQFLDERADTIKGLTNRAKTAARAQRLDNELQDFIALMDELGENLDQYSERKADMRLALKKLNDVAPKWQLILKALPGEPGFDEARKEALEGWDDLADQAKRLLSEQTEYFALHKDEKGQERAEPK